MNNGGRLMIIKAASQRLSPHLLVDTHTGYRARAANATRAHGHPRGCGRRRKSIPRCRPGRCWANRQSRSTPTSSMSASRRLARIQLTAGGVGTAVGPNRKIIMLTATTAAASAITGATVTCDIVAPSTAPPHIARTTL